MAIKTVSGGGNPFSEAVGTVYLAGMPEGASQVRTDKSPHPQEMGLVDFLREHKRVFIIGADTNARWLLEDFVRGLPDEKNDEFSMVYSCDVESCDAMGLCRYLYKTIQAKGTQGVIILLCPGEIFRRNLKERANNSNLFNNRQFVIANLARQCPGLDVLVLIHNDFPPRF